MSRDDFARFLESLSPDVKKSGHPYVCLHQKLVGFFTMNGIADPADAADETIERAAVKISGGAHVPDPKKYCLGIARNIVKERWRRERREDTVFRRFIDSLADGSAEEVERIQRVLQPCFEHLEDEDRELLMAYCQIPEGQYHAEYRRQLAEKLGMTVQALRTQISRLRDKLAECVEGRSDKS